MPRTYVDNAYNRSHGRVGLTVGSAVISKNTIGGFNTKTYVDNAHNRSMGRVGMSHGSAVESKYSKGGLTTWNYLDTDRDKTVCTPRVPGSYEPKQRDTGGHTWQLFKDLQQAERDSEAIVSRKPDRPQNMTVSNHQTVADIRQVNEAVFDAELSRMESQKAMMQFQTEKHDDNFTTCHICYSDMQDASITPCGHHFCTHCILQLLERNPRCPRCSSRLRESELIRDQEFDVIVKNEKQLGQAEVTKVHAANQLTETVAQVQSLSGELKKTREKNKTLVQQIHMYESNCEELRRELYELKENVLAEQQRVITVLRHQSGEHAAVAEQYKQELIMWRHQGQQLKQYQKLLHEKDVCKKEGAQNRQEDEKNQAEQLMRYQALVDEKDVEIAALKEDVSAGKRAIRHLQYTSKNDTEKIGPNTLSEKELRIMQQLHNYYDGLARVVRAYTDVIEENSELHRKSSKFDDRVRSLKKELHVAKAKAHKLERKHLSERNLTED